MVETKKPRDIIAIEKPKKTKKIILGKNKGDEKFLQEGCVPEDIELAKKTSDDQNQGGQGREYDADDVPTDPVDAMLDTNN